MSNNSPRELPFAASGSLTNLISTTSGPNRRASMTELQQNERRASIQLIMKDPNLSALEKRRRVQNLMDGRRASSDCMVNPYMEMKAKLAEEKKQQEEVQQPSEDNRHSYQRRRSSDGATIYDTMEIEPTEASMDNILSSTSPSIHSTKSDCEEDSTKKHPYQASTTLVPMIGCNDQQSRCSSIKISKRAVQTAPSCTHYSRKCHIISPCCGATFGCRICHDDCPILPPLLNPDGFGSMECASERGGGETQRKFQKQLRTSSMPMSLDAEGPPEHHTLDRFAIREIICRECFTRQGSKTNLCINCNVQFGEYHCAICNLWMMNTEKPYHCPDCGFCRVGGGENFRHCQDW